MPKAIEKPEERNVEELLERFKESAKNVAEGRTSKIEEIKGQIEEKK